MTENIRIASYFGDIGTCGRNDGSPLYITHRLRSIFGPENIAHLFPKGDLSKFGKFDYHLLVDWGEDALGYEDFELPHPSIYITSDTHLGFDYRLSRAKRCDWVFCNQRQAREDFVKAGIPGDRCFWLPHAFDPGAYSPGFFNLSTDSWNTNAAMAKRYDVCFVGHLNDLNRVTHLDRLFKAFPNFYWGVKKFHEAAEVFNQSRIVFNVSSRKELNMRHFEALGCKSLLLSDLIPQDQNVFEEGKHFVGYSNMDEMIEKAKYYLAHEDEANKIAEAGYLEAISKHTYLHRILAVLDTVGVPYDRNKAMSLLPDVQREPLVA